jgi:glycosyltransferase involved in cell wall biosynthesis
MVQPGYNASFHSGGYTVIPTRDRGRYVVGAIEIGFKVAKLAHRGLIDVVHSNGFEAMVVKAFAGKRVPLVFSSHHGWLPPSISRPLPRPSVSDLRQLYHERTFIAEGYGARAAERVVAVSNYARRLVINRLGVLPDKVRVVPHGVDTAMFVPSARRDPASIRIGFVGRLVYPKAPDVVLRALRLLTADYPDLVADFVGGGDESTYRMLGQQLGLTDNIVWSGRKTHSELRDAYHSFDILVAPSRTESFGLAQLEAMSSGVPVVSTRVGAVPEIVEDGVSGILVEPDEPRAVAAAVQSLLECSDLRLKMGQMARRRSVRCFTWDRTIDLLEMVYQSL